MGFLMTLAVIGLPGVIGAAVLRQGGSPTQASWVMLTCSAAVGLGFGAVASLSADSSDAGAGALFFVVAIDL